MEAKNQAGLNITNYLATYQSARRTLNALKLKPFLDVLTSAKTSKEPNGFGITNSQVTYSQLTNVKTDSNSLTARNKAIDSILNAIEKVETLYKTSARVRDRNDNDRIAVANIDRALGLNGKEDNVILAQLAQIEEALTDLKVNPQIIQNKQNLEAKEKDRLEVKLPNLTPKSKVQGQEETFSSVSGQEFLAMQRRNQATDLTRYDPAAKEKQNMITVFQGIFGNAANVPLKQEIKRSEEKALFPGDIQVKNIGEYIAYALDQADINPDSIDQLANHELDQLFDVVMILASNWFESEQQHEAPKNLKEVYKAIEPDKLGNGFKLLQNAAINLFTGNLPENGYTQIDVGGEKPLTLRNDFINKVVAPAVKTAVKYRLFDSGTNKSQELDS